ncbi:hypothetical protein H2199_007550 [Coniosporium tulheliwenetii]|uniref:Uncharacterized protein n=1 Tax=Coniosporium tulheliwenetii TaxID=3383036 RepID=A0ACC2YPS0_9PEZI|nr:hypothetical protein H2199_007550 [Cladosporium sp. JES 115]
MQLSSKTYKPSRSSKDTAPAPPPSSSRPVLANYASHHLTIGCGVAIFHVASARVVLCFHSRDRYWFLPKGRRDANEESGRAAEREGMRSGSAVPLLNRARLDAVDTAVRDDAVYPLLVCRRDIASGPAAPHNIPYLNTSTFPAAPKPSGFTAAALSSPSPHKTTLRPTPALPPTLSLRTRIAQEPPGYEPPKEEGTGVDAEEALYLSFLVPVAEAREKLRGSLMADVVAKGWEGCLRG